MLFSLSVKGQRKTVTDKLQVTSVKNAEVLKTDSKGNLVAGEQVDLTPIQTELGKKVDKVALDGLYGGKSEATSGRFLYLFNDARLRYIKDTLINTSPTSALLRTTEAQDGSNIRHTVGLGNKWHPNTLESRMEFRDAEGNIRAFYENRSNGAKIEIREVNMQNRASLMIDEKNAMLNTFYLDRDRERVVYSLGTRREGVILEAREKASFSTFNLSTVGMRFQLNDSNDNSRTNIYLDKGKIILNTQREPFAIRSLVSLDPSEFKLGFVHVTDSGISADHTLSGIRMVRTDHRTTVEISDFLKLKPMSAPATATAEKGMIYFDSADNKLKCYDGTTWHNLF